MTTRDWTAISAMGTLVMLAMISCGETSRGVAIGEQTIENPGVVTGTITYDEGTTLSAEAVVEVKLLTIGFPPVPIAGEHTIERPGAGAIRFDIEYDTTAVVLDSFYHVEAVIKDTGKKPLTTRTFYPVITFDNPTHVDIVLLEGGGPPPEYAESPAFVESVNLVVSNAKPPQYALKIVSILNDSCVSLNGYAVEQDGNTINVSVTNRRQVDAICLTVVDHHEGTVELGGAFTPGQVYDVVVNGELRETFMAGDPATP